MSNDESDSLEGALGNVSQLLRKRVRDLEKREEEFKRMKKSFEEANPAAGNPSDVLRLNVGGSRIDVLRRTLTSVDGSCWPRDSVDVGTIAWRKMPMETSSSISQ